MLVRKFMPCGLEEALVLVISSLASVLQFVVRVFTRILICIFSLPVKMSVWSFSCSHCRLTSCSCIGSGS